VLRDALPAAPAGGLTILHILKATEEHRCTPIRSGAGRLRRGATCSRAEPGLWMRGMLQINAACWSMPFWSAAFSSSAAACRGRSRGGAWSVSFRVCPWPSARAPRELPEGHEQALPYLSSLRAWRSPAISAWTRRDK